MTYSKLAYTLRLIEEKEDGVIGTETYLRTEMQCEGGVSGLSNERSTTREKNTPTSACIGVITYFME